MHLTSSQRRNCWLQRVNVEVNTEMAKYFLISLLNQHLKAYLAKQHRLEMLPVGDSVEDRKEDNKQQHTPSPRKLTVNVYIRNQRACILLLISIFCPLFREIFLSMKMMSEIIWFAFKLLLFRHKALLRILHFLHLLPTFIFSSICNSQ